MTGLHILDKRKTMNEAEKPSQGEIERRIQQWKSLVYDSVAVGYLDSYDEYANDLGCRDFIERNRKYIEATPFWVEILKIDQVARENFIPTKGAWFGNPPKEHFWFWSYPRNSPQLEESLRLMQVL